MCDTFVVVQSGTSDGSILFGKNSDREPNEAQVLEYHPAQTHAKGEKVQCTYIKIPQVKETHPVLLSRPFWMWGAEMGANDKGLVIGNEAVWTRMPLDKGPGLTGMDLLRLALERSAKAENGMEEIIRLISDHGQGGICGYEDKRMAYHNSFIIADLNEAWVLETAGPLWAALKVKDFYTISNGLTIGEEFDACHRDLIGTAKKKGWLKKGKTFHFAQCYSDWLFTTFSASRTRRERSSGLINDSLGEMDVNSAIRILRDHNGNGYRPHAHLLGTRLCAHAANGLTRNATQTTGSLVAHLKKEAQTLWATGTSAPCTGIFKPIWFKGEVLPHTGPAPTSIFDPEAMWWHHETLHRSVLLDYPARIRLFSKERDELERSFITRACDKTEGRQWSVSETAFAQAKEATSKWLDLVQEAPIRGRTSMIYRRYWQRQNRKAGINKSLRPPY